MQYSFFKRFRPLIIGFLVLLLAFGGYQMYLASQFHIVRTDPKLSAFPAIYPYLTVSFNRTLNPSSLTVNDVDRVIAGTKVVGKTVEFNLKSALSIDQEYTIIIKSIRSTDGEQMTNEKLVFTAKDIKFDDLTKTQQEKLVSNQDQRIYDVSHINFTNFDNLLEEGFTISQQSYVKDRIFDYSRMVGKQFWEIILVPGSIVYTQGTDTQDQADFTISIGNKSLKVHLDFDALDDSNLHVTLAQSDGVIVYDSAVAGD